MQDRPEDQQQVDQEIEIDPEIVEAAQNTLNLFPGFGDDDKQEEEPINQVESPQQEVTPEVAEPEVEADPERLPPVTKGGAAVWSRTG